MNDNSLNKAKIFQSIFNHNVTGLQSRIFGGGDTGSFEFDIGYWKIIIYKWLVLRNPDLKR